MQNYDDERSSYVDTRDENVHISGRRIKLFKNSIEIVPEPRMLGKTFQPSFRWQTLLVVVHQQNHNLNCILNT